MDPAFDPASSTGCDLLVRLGMDNFSYAILDKKKNKIMAVYDEQECNEPIKRVTACIKTDPNLVLPYQNTKLAVYTENIMHIPEALFANPEFQVSAAYFPDVDPSHIHHNIFPQSGFRSVFGLSAADARLMENLWPGHRKFVQSTPLCKTALSVGGTALVLDFTVGTVYAAYFRNNELMFQQSYAFADTDELTYYLLLMSDLLAVNRESTPVYMSGIIHTDDEKYARISSYFKEISPLLPVNAHLNMDILDDMPGHYYTTLLALDQCE